MVVYGAAKCSNPNRTTRVWNIATGVCQHILYGHTSTVRCLALHGDIVVSGSRDATVRYVEVKLTRYRISFMCVLEYGIFVQVNVSIC